MIDKLEYEEYRNSLLNISRLTTKENSVLINFDIKDDVCTNVVSFIQQDGTKDILKDSTFVCSDEFYKDLLEKFVLDYYSNMVVAFNDSIDMNADGKYTYRVVTDDNDMLSIDGISLEYANYLTNIVNRNQGNIIEDITMNEDGVGTAIASFILVVGIGLSFLLMLCLLS